MMDIAYVDQPLDVVFTMRKPDGTLEALAGHTADVIPIPPDGTPLTPIAATVDSGTSTVTATIPASELTGASPDRRGIWKVYPVIDDSVDNWAGSASHFHLKARGK